MLAAWTKTTRNTPGATVTSDAPTSLAPHSPALAALLALSAGDTDHLYLKLLGEVKLIWAGQILLSPGPKPLALLAYLHLHGVTGRDELAEVFWPDKSNALQNVRQALTTLRRLGGAEGGWLIEESAGLSLAAISDVSEVQRLAKAGDFEGALLLLRGEGELLGQLARPSEVFENWLEDEAAPLKETYLQTLHARGQQLVESGDFDAARELFSQARHMEGENEATYRDLMRLEHRAGNTAQALEMFELCRRMLEEELNVPPSEETLELLQLIENRDTGGNQRGQLLTGKIPFPQSDEPLFGREGVRQRLLTLLQTGGRVLLHGLGGMGKTRVASAAAAHFTAEGHKALWLEVNGDPAGVVLAALTDLLHLRAGQPLLEGLQRENVALIVLDNATNTYALHHILSQLPGEVPVLITSRLRLPNLTRVELTRLDRESALQVLQYHLGDTAQPTFNQEALCALLGDHPFALRLAARTLGKTPGADVIQALYDAPHDTIRVLLEQSLSSVTPRQYEVFLGLGSLYAPHGTPELLSLLLTRPQGEIEEALWELVERGLVSRESRPGSDTLSFRMHDLTWHAARERRAHLPHHLTAAVTRHAEASTDNPDLLATDLPHLLGAAAGAPPELLRRLMRGWLGGGYIGARGFPTAHLHLLHRAAQSAEQAEDWDTASVLNGKAADIAQALMGDQMTAIERLLRAAEQAGRTGQFGRQATHLASAGQMEAQKGIPVAFDHLQRAQEIAHQSGQIAVQARVRSQQAMAYAFRQEFSKAHTLLSEAREWMEDHLRSHHTDKALWAAYLSILGNLGQSEMRLGNLQQALELKREVGRLAAERDERLYMARSAFDQGELLNLLHQPQEAMTQLRQAIEISQEIGAGSLESMARQLLQNIASAN